MKPIGALVGVRRHYKPSCTFTQNWREEPPPLSVLSLMAALCIKEVAIIRKRPHYQDFSKLLRRVYRQHGEIPKGECSIN
jgi:hypothetical protein